MRSNFPTLIKISFEQLKVNRNIFCWLLLLFSFYSIKIALSNESHKQTINFNKITIEDGLSQSYVYHIIQDHIGYIWIATQDGLNKYDGRSFTVYKHDPDDKKSISDSDVRVLYEDKSNRLWIATYGKGLNLFDRNTQMFKNYSFDSINNNFNTNYIHKIIEDEKNILWMASRAGIIRFDPLTEISSLYELDVALRPTSQVNEILKEDANNMVKDLILVDDSQLLLTTEKGAYFFDTSSLKFSAYLNENDSVNNISFDIAITDKNKDIWLASSDKGVFWVNPKTEEITHFPNPAYNQESFGRVSRFYEDNSGFLWLASSTNGLFYFDRESQQWLNYQANPDDPTSLTKNNILDIFQDKTGLYWVGTWSGGINTFNLNNQYFNNYLSIPYKKNTLSAPNIWSVIQTRDRHYWFGSDGGGLTRYDPFTETFNSFLHSTEDPHSLSGNKIWSLGEREDGLLWVGTFYSGLNLFDPKTGKVTKKFQNTSKLSPLIYPESVISMLKLKNGDWWFGTTGQGVAVFDAKTESFKFYNLNSNNNHYLNSNRVYSLFQDSSDRIWVGTENGGLNLYQNGEDKFKFFLHKNSDTNSLVGNNVLSISEDKNGHLLVGTDLGLSKMISLGQFKNYSEKTGLSSSVINGVLNGCDDNIWLSTNNGISRINTADETINNYNKKDGLLNQEFNSTAYALGLDCELLFGGFEGAVSFVPKANTTEAKPELILTNVLKYFKPFKTLQEINEIELIEFSYQDQVVSFLFALIDFNNPSKHHYYYRLDNSIKGWIDLGNTNQVNLTNLDYGKHLLEVKGKISANNWSDIKSINIYVTPPFWRTNIAYIVYFLIVASLICLIYLNQLTKIRTQKKNFLKEQETNNKLRRLDKLKDQFLANTSHELRTPLNAIIGLSNVILDQGVHKFPLSELDDLISIIKDSGENLLILVNDILDYSALNENKLRIQLGPVELKPMVDNLINKLSLINKNENISINNNIPFNLPLIKADQQRFSQILLNLLNNAIKFTHLGQVNINAKQIGNLINITVSDTGIGIAKNHLGLIFNRFEQVEGENSRQYAGTGLGLAITKELIELHGGSINVKSELGKGTTFDLFIDIWR